MAQKRFPKVRAVLVLSAVLVASAIHLPGQGSLPAAKPIPRLQALPLPLDQISFERDGLELTRYYYATNLNRPFLHPINGPSGISLTRMGHPRDPQSHKHHNSVWISHQSVHGVNFWEDGGAGTIAHQTLEEIEDGDETARVRVLNAWRTGNKILLWEHRQLTVKTLSSKEWLLVIDLRFETKETEIILGQTAFGLLGVRMAKTIGVRDGGGIIRNSEGGTNEAGAFRKPARWVDYSGPITSTALEGITLMDHPSNRNHPSVFHVREDGWMGSALTYGGEIKITPEQPLALRYGLYVHATVPAKETIDRVFREFAGMKNE
ncbi:MAG TPA: PmoA family protein [Candidatus Paceibacterota bacterium]|nr:PmoA family protein [Verrucomicrobiota bacterium]HRY47116.1 PmoA family protein [Candidatus Paceibacterota bacterium]